MVERFDITFKLAKPKSNPGSSRPAGNVMRILILGDFSGRGLSGECRQQISERQAIVRVDLDNFDQVMSLIAPRLKLHFDQDGVSTVELMFCSMDDFHPDALFRKLELFQGLADRRERLNNPATFAEAAEQLRRHLQLVAESPYQKKGGPMPESDAAMLERLLGDRPADIQQSAGEQAKTAAASYIEKIVAQYIVPDAPPFKDVYLKAADDALSAIMRKVLHHPHFQALEASWRALEMLVNNLETGEALSLHLLDSTKEELLTELSASGEHLAESGLYRLLVDENVDTFGGEPWSLLVGNYSFGGSAEDVALLAACGVLASHVGGPFIAAADAGLLGCNSLAESSDPHDWKQPTPEAEQRWQALRQSPAASWLGLALPRILLRLPNGQETVPIDCFNFEEITSPDEHEAFLWGNPAFFCALLLGRSYLERGHAMQPDDCLQIDDLPAYSVKKDGESRLLPCAEAGLSDRAMESILDLGIMPFLSHRNRNSVRLARFQSLSYPASGLHGFWRY